MNIKFRAKNVVTVSTYSCLSGVKRQLDFVTKKKIENKVVRYPCDECKFAAASTVSLKRHTESKHEGKRYPCD